MNEIKRLLASISASTELINAQLRDLKTRDITWIIVELKRVDTALEDALYIFEAEDLD